MRIAVVCEVSTREKSGVVVQALKEAVPGAQIYNIGMSENGSETELTYIHTGFIAALALYSGAADFVVGGCGTGQGFMVCANQYPGVVCGFADNPLDAWLFSQINAGNCISLPLNRGYGWAGDINLRHIFEKLFCDAAGQGYPLHRSETQAASRNAITKLSKISKRSIPEIMQTMDPAVVSRVMSHGPFLQFVAST